MIMIINDDSGDGDDDGIYGVDDDDDMMVVVVFITFLFFFSFFSLCLFFQIDFFSNFNLLKGLSLFLIRGFFVVVVAMKRTSFSLVLQFYSASRGLLLKEHTRLPSETLTCVCSNPHCSFPYMSICACKFAQESCCPHKKVGAQCTSRISASRGTRDLCSV